MYGHERVMRCTFMSYSSDPLVWVINKPCASKSARNHETGKHFNIDVKYAGFKFIITAFQIFSKEGNIFSRFVGRQTECKQNFIPIT